MMRVTVQRLLAGSVLAAAVAAGACDSPSAPKEETTETPPVATPPPVNGYDVKVRYVGEATARQQQAMNAAVSRWRSVIVGDLPNVPINAQAGSCFATQPAINETVDDLLIFVEFVEIDGPAKILGEAGPCFIRSESSLPVMGHIRLDAADLRQMETAGTLDDVVLHEVGHILGIGTLWPMKALVVGSGGEDPQFTGTRAAAAYQQLGAAAQSVPVENTGSTGTRDSHWRESVFANELMTGYLGMGANPLSALTVASLQDLGYGASAAGASTYTLAGGVARVTEALDLHGRERVLKPKFKVDRQGRQEKLKD